MTEGDEKKTTKRASTKKKTASRAKGTTKKKTVKKPATAEVDGGAESGGAETGGDKTGTTKQKKVKRARTARPKAAGGRRLRVKQVRSTIHRQKRFLRTLSALGLKHHQDEVVVTDSPSVQGMLTQVRSFVRVTPEDG